MAQHKPFSNSAENSAAAWLPSSAGGGVAEGRGGVVKLSLTTDLVSNLQTNRGMKRGRFISNPKTSKDYRRELRRNLTPAEALLWRALKTPASKGRSFADNTE